MQDDKRLALDKTSYCLIYSRSRKLWFEGMIEDVFIDSESHKEWLVIRYGPTKKKKMQRFCNDLKPMASSPSASIDPRASLHIHSACKIFSRTQAKWLRGKIAEIYFEENNTEWLVVKYGTSKSKTIQRFCDDLQCVTSSARNTSRMQSNDDLMLNLFSGDDARERRMSYSAIDSYKERIRCYIKPVGPWKLVKQLAFPTSAYSRMIPISGREFLVATAMRAVLSFEASRSGDHPFGIYSYDVVNNRLQLLTPYDATMQTMLRFDLGAFDQVGKELYLGLTAVECLYKIEFYNQRARTRMRGSSLKYIYATYIDGERFELLHVSDSRLHLVGSILDSEEKEAEIHQEYAIWDTHKGCRLQRCRLSGDIPNSEKSMIAFLKSQRKLLAFVDEDVYECPLNTGQWKLLPYVKIPYQMEVNDNFCITSDEKHIIFVKRLVVLELETMKFYAGGRVQVPFSKSYFNASIMPLFTDEEKKVITFGFMQKILNEQQSDMLIPTDVVVVICWFWNKDSLYLMDRHMVTPNLWRISVEDLLSNLREMKEDRWSFAAPNEYASESIEF